MAALATQADVEANLVRNLTAEEVDFADVLLDQASQAVRSYTRQTLDRVTGDVVVVEGDGSRMLLLPQLPVVSVASVVVRGVTVDPSSYQAVNGGIRTIGGLFASERRFEWGGPGWWPEDQFTVTYDHGFAPVPKDIVGVVSDLVATRLRAATANPGGLQSETRGPYSATFAGRLGAGGTGVIVLDPGHREALYDYRRRAGSVEVVRGVDMSTGRGGW